MIMMMMASPLLAEETDSLFMQWGVGIIRPKEFIESDIFNFPNGWITVYDANRRPFGKLRKIFLEIENSNYPYLELNIPGLDTLRDFGLEKEYVETTYEGGCAIFHQSDQSYVRILRYSAPEYEIWIRKDQLDDFGFCVQSWKEFMTENKTFYYPLFHRIAHLRDVPSDTAAIVTEITDANNKEFEIILTGQWQGNWAYATVELLTEIHGRDRKVLEHWKGWIKVIDPKGYPLIWYYSRGC